MTRFSGVVLAGGAGRRMGREKALIEVDGEPMVARVAAALHEAGAAEVLVVGGEADPIVALGLEHVPDRWPAAGPLGALVTALGVATHDPLVVLAVDLVDPSAQAVRRLLDTAPEADVVVPVSQHRRQVLHGRYAKACLTTFEAAFDAGERSVRLALGSFDVVEVDGIDPVALRDADRPSDLAGRARGIASP